MAHMNVLNLKLHGKDQFVYEIYTNLKAFEARLTLFPRQISNNSFCNVKIRPQHVHKYNKSLDDLQREFAVDSLILKKLKNHFSWCHVPVTGI